MKRILIVSLALLFVLVPVLPTLAQDEPVTTEHPGQIGRFPASRGDCQAVRGRHW